MYTYKDERYTYSPKFDYKWAAKSTKLLWRGVTSGGTQFASSWNRLHRQRFVQLTNATELAGKNVSLLTKDEEGRYKPVSDFAPSKFAASHFDVGFTQAGGAYLNVPSTKESGRTSSQQHSASNSKPTSLADGGRSSKVGLSASKPLFSENGTIPACWRGGTLCLMDNMFGDLYALMTYFIGISPAAFFPSFGGAGVHVPAHDAEAQAIATQGRDWAQVALRDEDMEIYLYLLLLEYARVIDDNRDHIGYSGDGTPLDLNK
ncbi:hypothetical protein N7470_009356 [Penicillium chermesinum]|nr:hypothetical protein N7470_009356 [Penicillium chermesinum]